MQYGYADRLVPPFYRVVRGALRNRLYTGIRPSLAAHGALHARGKGPRCPSHGAAFRPLGNRAGPVRYLWGGELPVSHGHGVFGTWLRQARGQLPGNGHMGRKGHRAELPKKRLEKSGLGDQARGRIARNGQLDDERGIVQRAKFVLLLRLLLSWHAGDKRV